jgi:hypothetical protein
MHIQELKNRGTGELRNVGTEELRNADEKRI